MVLHDKRLLVTFIENTRRVSLHQIAPKVVANQICRALASAGPLPLGHTAKKLTWSQDQPQPPSLLTSLNAAQQQRTKTAAWLGLRSCIMLLSGQARLPSLQVRMP